MSADAISAKWFVYQGEDAWHSAWRPWTDALAICYDDGSNAPAIVCYTTRGHGDNMALAQRICDDHNIRLEQEGDHTW